MEFFLEDYRHRNKNKIAIWLLHVRKRVKCNDKYGLREPAQMGRV